MKQATKRLQAISYLSNFMASTDNSYKRLAYKNAILLLASMTDSQFLKTDDFKKYKGIGSSINEKLQYVKVHGYIDDSEAELDTKVRAKFTNKRITRQTAKKYIDKFVKKYNITEYTVAGSYRRKKPTVGDIDLLVPANTYKSVLKELTEEIVSSGDKQTQLMIDPKNKIVIDLIPYTKTDYPYKLLHYTGSAEFNITMRSRAQEFDYKLNQYGLWLGNKLIKCKDEEDIFKKLKVKYLEPENR